MRVLQHIPAFFEGFEPIDQEVKSAEELLALPFVARWKHDLINRHFHQFSVDRNYWANASTWPGDGRASQQHELMAEFEEGYVWWVVAHLSGGDSLEILKSLPDWKPLYREGEGA